MMGTQHKVVGIGFGIATALYVAEGLGEPAPAMLSMAAATVGSMLPDIDHDRSRIGRKRKLQVPFATRYRTGRLHRLENEAARV